MDQPQRGTPRWRRMPQDRAAAILTAALSEFAVKGLAGARMDDIALAGGLSKGSIYRYFPDKATLFAATIHSTLEDLLTLGGGGTPPDRQLFLRKIWGIITQPRFRAAYKLSLIPDPSLGEVGGPVSALIEKTVVLPLAAILTQTEGESPLPQDAALIRARLATATLLGAVLTTPDTPESVDSTVAFLLRACELEAQSPQADGF